jgi:methionyl-tRNA formyltransferase
VLEALHQAHEIVAVYCQPPRPAGRGRAERQSPVESRAKALGLQVQHPVSLRYATAASDMAALTPDVAVVVAYGLILPQEILDVPRLGCLNIHASLLPRWRGAAPIHRAIMAGDSETGVCIMQMQAGLDTGPVLAREAVAIAPEDTTATLHDKLSAIGAQKICSVLAGLPMQAQAQSSEGVTYAAKIDKAEARIDWQKPAVEIDRQIRGLSPFPGAWCEISGERVKLLASRIAAGQGAPGTVLAGMVVACGTGAVEITAAQRAGGQVLSGPAFRRGFEMPARLA